MNIEQKKLLKIEEFSIINNESLHCFHFKCHALDNV